MKERNGGQKQVSVLFICEKCQKHEMEKENKEHTLLVRFRPCPLRSQVNRKS
jgi:hypothetical protein